jgi:prepilin-type N-terminal cleavage/methylation domain-containing protein/prepilin-type processing-associated H-X9-DG protein
VNPQSSRRARGFTLVEMLVVIGIIGLLAALLLPVLAKAKARAKRIECLSNQHEIGLAAHLFANDHGGKFPVEVSTNDGGSLEIAAAGNRILNRRFYFAYLHFLPLAGTLSTPKLLACPSDPTRWQATNFNQFNNSNVSYTLGLTVDPGQPNLIFAADWTLDSCHRNPPNPTIGQLYATGTAFDYPSPYWQNSVHEGKGNLLFCDGHAEESYAAIFLPEVAVNESLVYPDLPPSASVPPDELTPTSPTTSGGGSGGSGGTSTSSSGARSGAAQGGPAAPGSLANPNQSGGTNISAATPPAVQDAAARNHSANQKLVAASGSRQNRTLAAGDQTEIVASNSVPEPAAVTTNVPPPAISSAGDDDPTMSPFDRELAKILRDIIVGTYFLILLLLLLFAAYRYWCWTQDPERQRRATRNRR